MLDGPYFWFNIVTPQQPGGSKSRQRGRRLMFKAIKTRAIRVAMSGVVLAWLAACQSVGPTTIPRDRFDYSEAIGESWKRQMLLNIVRLRYADTPLFIDVGQVVAGYTLETAVSVGGVISSSGAVQGNSGSLGSSGRFTDRPTITYTPLTGNRFIENIATPITPAAIFETIESGFPVHAMLMLGIDSINGLHNVNSDMDGARPADPRFLEVVQLLRDAQRRSAFGIRTRVDSAGGRATVVTLRSPQASDEDRAAALRIRELLGLDPEATEFELVGGEFAVNAKQIAVRGRSLLRVLQVLSLYVEVPEQDVTEGRASRGLDRYVPGSSPGAFRVLSSDDEPEDVAVSVRYRDRYFYVSDRDLSSKRLLSFIMILFSLADRSEEAAKPVLTIPTQ